MEAARVRSAPAEGRFETEVVTWGLGLSSQALCPHMMLAAGGGWAVLCYEDTQRSWTRRGQGFRVDLASGALLHLGGCEVADIRELALRKDSGRISDAEVRERESRPQGLAGESPLCSALAGQESACSEPLASPCLSPLGSRRPMCPQAQVGPACFVL